MHMKQNKTTMRLFEGLCVINTNHRQASCSPQGMMVLKYSLPLQWEKGFQNQIGTKKSVKVPIDVNVLSIYLNMVNQSINELSDLGRLTMIKSI